MTKLNEKQITEMRSKWIDLLNENMEKFYGIFINGLNRHSGPIIEEMKTSAHTAVADIRLSNALLLKMKESGKPKELIFIDRKGTPYSLIKQKELEGEELINIVLDNKKLHYE